MTKEEKLQKLCAVLYNGIKAKLKSLYEVNIDTLFLPNSIECELGDAGMAIYDHDTNPYDKTVFSKEGIENIGGKPMLIKSAIALLFLTEAFAQGHKYKIDWGRGINIFGEFSPAIVFDEEDKDGGAINYYIQMVNILADGVSEDNE